VRLNDERLKRRDPLLCFFDVHHGEKRTMETEKVTQNIPNSMPELKNLALGAVKLVTQAWRTRALSWLAT
jgi:hypothetical protein